ncbi:hypothetical protein J1G44_17130 [Cellulomonas sp. zg-ZUI199]|uniref:GNAT family N-acetyltransferase n=2 Tax=Cellulomonas TaxID=1707 RepID=A0ABX8D785_9CELL|nr:hypothetical protein [Cellulomonas wangleii]MBO0926200.1 hypothetical protein [Cellulomonas wangleii]QVI62710.1 hypothetical protein KG103_01845 [Cellulomonas wangleii]
MTVTSLRLRALTPQDEAPARRAHDVMAREGFEFLLGPGHDGDWSDYLGRMEDHRAGVGRTTRRYLVPTG